MRKVAMGLLCLGVLCFAGALWAGEAPPAKAEEPPAKAAPKAEEPPAKAEQPPAKAAPDVDALKKQAADLLEKDKALRTKLEEIRTKIQASPDVAKLREAEAAQAKAYDEKLKGDQGYAAARKAQAEAQAAAAKVVQEKVAANDEAKAALETLASGADKAAELEFEEAKARLETEHPSSPINVALDKDPELAKLRDTFHQATDKEPREKARKAYADARKAKLEAHPDAKKAIERIEAARKGRADLKAAVADAQKKLSSLRAAVAAGNDADVKAARDKVAAAAKAVAEASNSDVLKAARKAGDDAHAAVSAKLKELLAANPDAAALIKDRTDLRTKLDELDKQVRQASKK